MMVALLMIKVAEVGVGVMGLLARDSAAIRAFQEAAFLGDPGGEDAFCEPIVRGVSRDVPIALRLRWIASRP